MQADEAAFTAQLHHVAETNPGWVPKIRAVCHYALRSGRMESPERVCVSVDECVLTGWYVLQGWPTEDPQEIRQELDEQRQLSRVSSAKQSYTHLPCNVGHNVKPCSASILVVT